MLFADCQETQIPDLVTLAAVLVDGDATRMSTTGQFRTNTKTRNDERLV